MPPPTPRASAPRASSGKPSRTQSVSTSGWVRGTSATASRASGGGRSPSWGWSSVAEMRTVKLTSPDRVLFPEDGVTKGDVFDYYRRVGPTNVPHLRERPFTMERYPHGITGVEFFHKQAPTGIPDWTL